MHSGVFFTAKDCGGDPHSDRFYINKRENILTNKHQAKHKRITAGHP
jgi:hypothetical protein